MSVSVHRTHPSARERITIVTLGQSGHGKTMLLSALTRVVAQANNTLV